MMFSLHMKKFLFPRYYLEISLYNLTIGPDMSPRTRGLVLSSNGIFGGPFPPSGDLRSFRGITVFHRRLEQHGDVARKDRQLPRKRLCQNDLSQLFPFNELRLFMFMYLTKHIISIFYECN